MAATSRTRAAWRVININIIFTYRTTVTKPYTETDGTSMEESADVDGGVVLRSGAEPEEMYCYCEIKTTTS